MTPHDPLAEDVLSISNDLQPVHELDRIVHEPARLAILAALSKAEEVDFKFLEMVTGLTKGNLSRQASTLEEAEYIEIRKYHKGKMPATGYRITQTGCKAFATYWQHMLTLQQSFPAKNEKEFTT